MAGPSRSSRRLLRLRGGTPLALPGLRPPTMRLVRSLSQKVRQMQVRERRKLVPYRGHKHPLMLHSPLGYYAENRRPAAYRPLLVTN